MGYRKSLEVPKRRWTYFAIGATAAAAVSVAFAAFIALHPLGYQAVTAVDDIGEAVAALVAAAACGWASLRTLGRLRLAWTLIAISAASWGIGEVIWSIYEVGLGVAVPFPSLADVAFLTAVPFAIAGVLAFSTQERGTSTHWRVWLDGSIIVISLTVAGWAMGLREVYLLSGDSIANRLIGLAYPLGDVLVITALVLAIRRATSRQTGRMLLLLGGLLANSVADSTFAYLQAAGSFGVEGSVLDTGWVVGYLMIALAAMWPSGSTDDVVERAPIDLWQVALPWVGVGIAAATIAVQGSMGRPPDAFTITMAGILGCLVMVSQIATQRESASTVVKSRRSEATLSDVIGHAPAGVVRVGTDLRIQIANPRFNSLLRAGNETLIGLPIAQFLSESEASQVAGKLRALDSGAEEAVELESEVQRLDRTKAWLHWSATVVLKADGTTDYYIAMLEDTTARHEHEAAAAASLAVLERLNQVKSSFLHNVSHEFKTALTGIHGFSELIRDADDLDLAEVKGFAADIYRDADRLDRMVTEMLDLDRVETGRAALKLVSVDLNGLIVHELEACRSHAGGTTLVANLDPALAAIAGDQDKLSQVVRTLLDNAVRYSPDGGNVSVTSRMKDLDVEVVVRDQGTAARSDFDKPLFGVDDLYADSPIRSVVGTGLGLGIARQVVEMHGGRLWAERLDGSGSELHFIIPASLPRHDTAQPAQVPPSKRVA